MPYQAKHVYDALPSSRDHRDMLATPVDTSTLPPSIALPAVPVLDQGSEGACVGHGCAGARETLELIVNGALPMVPLSRAFIYYEARLLENTADQDSGAEVRDGCKVLNQMGVCTEAEFPYTPGRFADVPPDVDVTAAARYKIDAYARLINTDQVRAALASNMPVVIGINVYQSFETQIGPDGMVPLPGSGDQYLGGHCVFLKGYHPDPRNPGHFLFDAQNSWSSSWADHGGMHFTEDYLNNPNLTMDLWSVAVAAPVPPPVPKPPVPPPAPPRKRRWHWL
jgi:hypothetical protein